MNLDLIYDPIKIDLESVEQVLKDQVNDVLHDKKSKGIDDAFIGEMLTHLFKKPGKRLRPALVLLSAHIAGDVAADRREALVRLAAAVELIHSASLIHDDIIDEADERRKAETLNKRFDNTVAVLTGDILYAQFFSLLTGLPGIETELKLELFSVFSSLTRNMCLGEIFQHKIANRTFKPGIVEYLKVLENKTALLMSACCRCGALINRADRETANHLGAFGLNFGLAYQLTDDFIDKDSPIDEHIDLLEKAKKYISIAKHELFIVSLNGQGKYLDSLCDFILSRALSG